MKSQFKVFAELTTYIEVFTTKLLKVKEIDFKR